MGVNLSYEKLLLRSLFIFAFVVPIFLVSYNIFFGAIILTLILSGISMIILIIFLQRFRFLENRYLLVALIISSFLISINANYSRYWVAYTYRYFFMQNLNIDVELTKTYVQTEYIVNGDGTEWGTFIESTYQLGESPDRVLADLNSRLTKKSNWYGSETGKWCPYRERFSNAGGYASHTIVVEGNQLIIKLFYQPLIYGPLVKQSCFANS